jgi:hypothetical protein
MDVDGIRKAEFAAREGDPRDAGQREAAQPGTRALVPVVSRSSAPTSRFTRHAAAPFLAQLIANRQQAPQTRARRRVAPGEAIAVYRLMTKVTRGSGSRTRA